MDPPVSRTHYDRSSGRHDWLLIPEISWASQKIKIMFFNMEVPKPIQRGKTSTTMSLRIWCSRLVFREVANTRTSEAYCCKLTGRVWSLHGRDRRMTPRTYLRSVLRQQAVIERGGSFVTGSHTSAPSILHTHSTGPIRYLQSGSPNTVIRSFLSHASF